MADQDDFRFSQSRHPAPRSAAEPDGSPASDPLAELARLIGQNDPFAELERTHSHSEVERAVRTAGAQPQWHEPPAAPAAEPDRYEQAAERHPAADRAGDYGGGSGAAAGREAYAQYPGEAYAQYPGDGYAYPEEAYAEAGEGYQEDDAGYYDSDPEAYDEAAYQEELARRHRRNRLVTVVAIFAVAIIGGAAAYASRTLLTASSHSAPPVIMADTAPAKVVPASHGGHEGSAHKLSYDRVGEPDAKVKMVPREEKPVEIKTGAVAPQSKAAPPKPDDAIAPKTDDRAIAPAPSANIPATTGQTAASVLPLAASPSEPAIGSGVILPSPKKVNTIVVRPDMSVVPSDIAADATVPAPEQASADKPAAPAQPPAAAAAQTASTPPAPRSRPAKPAASTHETAAIPVEAPRRHEETPASHQQAARPHRNTAPARVAARAPRRPSAPLSLAPDQAQAPAQRSARAPSHSHAPLALAAATPEPRASQASTVAAPSGSYTVQVSSQRSETDAKASFRALQARYPTIMAGRHSFVHRVDLGQRGVYYRTLIGPFASASQARAFCTSLKAAGGNCLIHRN